MQCTEKFGRFLWAKWAAILQRYPCSCFCVSIPAVKRTFSFMTDKYGIFNNNLRTTKKLGVFHSMKGVQAQTAQELTRTEIEKLALSLTLPRQGIEPKVFGFEFRHSSLTTELWQCPP